MTAQQSLERVWANSGGINDPGVPKYDLGWISEIPTFQDFNYVLQTATINLLAFAEKDVYDWQADINYAPGSKVRRNNNLYHCCVANLNEDPVLDSLRNFWARGPYFGRALPTGVDTLCGVNLNRVGWSQDDGIWRDNDQTIASSRPFITYNSSDFTPYNNLIMGNIEGFMAIVNVGTATVPDNRNLSIGQPGTYKLFHEGNPQTQAQTPGTIPEAPLDGKAYARRNGAWVQVTSTVASIAPPPPTTGAGTGWYNLDDGVFYLDIDDGDSSQWVPANPSAVHLSGTGGGGTTEGETKILAVTSYTIAKADLGKILYFTAATAVTVTMPDDATVSGWGELGSIGIFQKGDGKVSLVEGGSSSILFTETLNTNKKNSICSLVKTSPIDEWIFAGDVELAP